MITRQAPPDQDCVAAYKRIVVIAREHGLVVTASGGYMLIATPDRQRREEGLREMVLRMHKMTEVPQVADIIAGTTDSISDDDDDSDLELFR